MKVLTWNVARAGASRAGVWEMVRDEDADIIMLQEVRGLPEWAQCRYQCHWITPRYFGGHNAPFSTAVLSKGLIDATPYLRSDTGWVNRIQAQRYGWIVPCETMIDGEPVRVVCVHSPAFGIPQEEWEDEDVSDIKLTNNPDVWFTEILWSLLADTGVSEDDNWIVGGDFNASVLFDVPEDRGNWQVIQRLGDLELVDCLSLYHDGPVPTFQHTRKTVGHQLDYCYVNGPLVDRLQEARVPDHVDVFGAQPRLSDHLPIVCDFG